MPTDPTATAATPYCDDCGGPCQKPVCSRCGDEHAPGDCSPDTAATVLTVRVERDTLDGGFVVRAAEAPGCVTQGETIPEALQNFADAFTDWAIARAVRAMAVPS